MKYKISISNLKDYTAIKEYNLSKSKIIVLSSLIVLAVVFITSLFFLFTPVKYLIPGFPDSTMRQKIISVAQNTTAMEKNLVATQRYVDNIHTILSGNLKSEDIENSKTESTEESKSYYNITFNKSKADSILRDKIEKGETESEFVPSVNRTDIDKLLFYRPLKGIVTDKYNSKIQHFGTDVVAKKNAIISSVLDGTVVFSAYSINTGHVIQVQHNNDLLSTYKHNSKLLKSVGDRIKKGEAIAVIGNSGEISTGAHLHFELWYNGIPLDPERYISFE